jgi:hypothetical protein
MNNNARIAAILSLALVLSACLEPGSDTETGDLQTAKSWYVLECGGRSGLVDSVNHGLEHVYIEIDSSGQATRKQTVVNGAAFRTLASLIQNSDLAALQARNKNVYPNCAMTRECRTFPHLTLETARGTETYSLNDRCIQYDSAFTRAFETVAAALTGMRLHPGTPGLPSDTCADVPAPLQAERKRLRENWAKWRALKAESYSFGFRMMCFCPHAGFWNRITVEKGKVTRVESEDPARPAISLERAPTLDSLFFTASEALCGRTEQLELAYDLSHGYITRMDINLHLMPVDGGYTAEVKEVVFSKTDASGP